MDETWHVTDIGLVMRNIEMLMVIREVVLGASLRDISHTLVQISALVKPELMIEVKCVAKM